jgi:hypothetical protein
MDVICPERSQFTKLVEAYCRLLSASRLREIHFDNNNPLTQPAHRLLFFETFMCFHLLLDDSSVMMVFFSLSVARKCCKLPCSQYPASAAPERSCGSLPFIANRFRGRNRYSSTYHHNMQREIRVDRFEKENNHGDLISLSVHRSSCHIVLRCIISTGAVPPSQQHGELRSHRLAL